MSDCSCMWPCAGMVRLEATAANGQLSTLAADTLKTSRALVEPAMHKWQGAGAETPLDPQEDSGDMQCREPEEEHAWTQAAAFVKHADGCSHTPMHEQSDKEAGCIGPSSDHDVSACGRLGQAAANGHVGRPKSQLRDDDGISLMPSASQCQPDSNGHNVAADALQAPAEMEGLLIGQTQSSLSWKDSARQGVLESHYEQDKCDVEMQEAQQHPR